MLGELGAPRPLTRVITVADVKGYTELAPDWIETFLLHDREIAVGPTINLAPDGTELASSLSPHHFAVHMHEAEIGRLPVWRLRETDRTTLLELHRRLQDGRRALPELPRALQLLGSLGGIHSYMPLRCLGYFTIVELLLTTKPMPTDPTSSLTRQVRGKMELIGRRCDPPIDWATCFAPPPKKKSIWELLYQYRSDLAHGNEPDFADQLKCLKSPAQIDDFMRLATRRLLRFALMEPVLVGDLKRC